MKFSIVTAVFNREKTIGQAIECLQRQTHSEYEHIIVDGKSKDSTLSIVRDRADGRTIVISEPDSGIYDALNKGMALATGDVVGLLHSDDMFASDQVLERVAGAFATDDIDGVYGDLEYVRNDATARLLRRWRAGHFRRERLRRGWMPPHPTVFLRRDLIEQYGDYDTAYRIAADYEAMLRYFSVPHLRWSYIPEVLVRMRTGGASNQSFRNMIRKSHEDYRSIRRHKAGGVSTLLLKNISKINQFFSREEM